MSLARRQKVLVGQYLMLRGASYLNIQTDWPMLRGEDMYETEGSFFYFFFFIIGGVV